MSFIKNLGSEFAVLPDELRAVVSASLAKLDERLAGLKLNINQSPEFSASIVKSGVPACLSPKAARASLSCWLT